MRRAPRFSFTSRLAVAASRLVLATLFVAAPARATYSIVATDQKSQQVGGATTSCVGAQSVASVFGPSPAHGGINAQAAQNLAGRDRGVMLLAMDVDPKEIIRQIIAPAFDPSASTRQYGIADLSGRSAGYTGSNAMAYKEDRQGTTGAYTYSVQGNILTSKKVLDQAEAAFVDSGCDLADKLMLALEAGAQNGEGDSRCTGTRNIPSDSASIEVDLSGAAARSYLYLSLSGTMNASPLIRLRSMFDTWRATHPCPGTDAGVDAGGVRDASSADTGTRSDASDARISDAGAGEGIADSTGRGGRAGSDAAGSGGANGGNAGGGGTAAGGANATSGAGGGSSGNGGNTTGAAGSGAATTTVATSTTTGGGPGGTGATGGTAGTGAGGASSGGNSGGGTTSDEGGCGCRTSRSSGSLPLSSVGLALAMVGLAARQRRRVR